MDPISFGLFEDKSLVASDARGSPDPIGWGLGCSAVLHVLVALLFVFGLPKLLQAPPPVEEAVSVDLVEFDGVSTSPGRQKEAGRQQEKPPDSPKSEPPKRDPLAEVKPAAGEAARVAQAGASQARPAGRDQAAAGEAAVSR